MKVSASWGLSKKSMYKTYRSAGTLQMFNTVCYCCITSTWVNSQISKNSSGKWLRKRGCPSPGCLIPPGSSTNHQYFPACECEGWTRSEVLQPCSFDENHEGMKREGCSYLHHTELPGEAPCKDKTSVTKTNLATTGPRGHSECHQLLYPIIQWK